MNLTVERVDIWAASIEDQPGNLTHMLALSEAGADLDFLGGRRREEGSDMSVVFVTPLHGNREINEAGDLGFNVTGSLSSIRIKGDNRPGIASELTKRLEAENINIREVSAAVIGPKFLLYIGLDSDQDAIKAVEILRQP